jgi:RNA polymerase sigma-70 factor, ECF subfamily
MNTLINEDLDLVKAVRCGDASAWERLIIRYQGRLTAFVAPRLHDLSAAEDVVQETFLGFLTSLPNYDEQTPLESFLFAIAAHKLTDVLRRTGRRPAMSLGFDHDLSDEPSGRDVAATQREPAGRDRPASSLARSRERFLIEERVLGDCLRGLIQSWFSRGEFERLECAELLFVLGWSNKEVAARMQLSEQAVANHKSFVVGKLKAAAEAARLRDVNWKSLAGE